MTSSANQLADFEAGGGPESLADATVRRVIVGVDDSPAGAAALAAAARLALHHGSTLIAVRAWALGLPRHGGRRMRHLSHPHVVMSFSGTEQTAAAKVLVQRAFRSALGALPAGMPLEIKTPGCDPAVALVSLARQPGDVIVIGRDSGHPLRRLIHGSVGRYCIRHAPCPVLLVPESGRPRETGRAAGRRRSASR